MIRIVLKRTTPVRTILNFVRLRSPDIRRGSGIGYYRVPAGSIELRNRVCMWITTVYHNTYLVRQERGGGRATAGERRRAGDGRRSTTAAQSRPSDGGR